LDSLLIAQRKKQIDENAKGVLFSFSDLPKTPKTVFGKLGMLKKNKKTKKTKKNLLFLQKIMSRTSDFYLNC